MAGTKLRLSSIDLVPEHAQDDIVWAIGELNQRLRTQADILFELNDRLATKGVEPISASAFNRKALKLRAAQIRLDEVNKLLEVELPSEESDTLGGFIYSEMGSVPVVGSRVHFDPLVIDVLSLSGRRIQQVKVTKQSPRNESETKEVQSKKTSLSPTATTSSSTT